MNSERTNCQELKDGFELYALGLLDGEERREIEEHLAGGCETCQASLRDALAVNALMMASVAPAKPPSGLKRRVLAGFGIERIRWGWLGAMATALMAAIALWLSVEERHRETELADARRQVIQITAERDKLNQVFTFLNQPETKQVNFGSGQNQPPRGNVFIHPRLGVLLIASNLPSLPAGKTFEMWVIRNKTSAPRPAGLFQATQGAGMNILPGAVDSLYAVAVSIEPEAGSQTPSDVILVAPVPGA